MTSYYVESALLAQGWAKNVQIKVTDSGLINKINSNVTASEEDIHLSGVLVPAMPNCHSHAFQRAFAGLCEYSSSNNDSFWSWRSMMYRFIEHLTPEQTHIIAKQLYIEMLKAGYSRVGEFHYLHHGQDSKPYNDITEMSNQVIEAASVVGIGMTFLPVFYRYAGFGKQQPTTGQGRFTMSLDEYLQYHSKLNSNYIHSEVIIGTAPHSLRAVDIEDLKQLVSTLEPDTATHIHIAEQIPEVQQSIEFSGLRPVEYLYNHMQPNSNWTLIHATHLTQAEIQQIIGSDSVVGICPTTEANLGDGIFAHDYLKSNGHWAIGSDSHISVNSCEELRWLEYTQRLQLNQRAVVSGPDVNSVGRNLWSKATEGGNQSLGANAGVISEGKSADFVIIDLEQPSLASKSEDKLLDSLIFSSHANSAIKDVIVGGKLVLRDYKHPLEEQVANQFKQVMRDLTAVI